VTVRGRRRRPGPAAGREGLIAFAPVSMAEGYIGDQSTAQMFRDGAFYSGDLGYDYP
jgi:hypothetical protein